MRILIQHPHFTPAVLVHREGFDDVYFGDRLAEGLPDRVAYVATGHPEPQPGATLLCLEPPIVEPWAYEADYRAGFRNVIAFHGAPTTHPFLHGIPPLWPELPREVHCRPWAERKDAVVAIMGNKHGMRRSAPLMALVNQARQLDLGFDLFGHPPWEHLGFYRGPLPFDQKREVLSQYRYCYCPENQSLPTYMSEKLPEALFAGCFPVYSGADPYLYPAIPWNWVQPQLLAREAAESHAELLALMKVRAAAIRDALNPARLYRTVLRAVLS